MKTNLTILASFMLMASFASAQTTQPAVGDAKVVKAVIDAVKEITKFELKSSQFNQALFELNKLDDLDLVEIVMELEDELQISMSDEDLPKIVGVTKTEDLAKKITANHLVQAVKKAQKAKPAK